MAVDDFEHHAFALRPRERIPGPFRIPDAATLGRRLRTLRWRFDLSVPDVADVAGLRHHQIEEFEEYGVASAETLLTLIEFLDAGDGLATAFEEPSFRSRAELVARLKPSSRATLVGRD